MMRLIWRGRPNACIVYNTAFGLLNLSDVALKRLTANSWSARWFMSILHDFHLKPFTTRGPGWHRQDWLAPNVTRWVYRRWPVDVEEPGLIARERDFSDSFMTSG